MALLNLESVAVAVDDLPLAVLPTVHLGDSKGVRVDWDAVDRNRGVFELDRVGQVAVTPAAWISTRWSVESDHRDAIERRSYFRCWSATGRCGSMQLSRAGAGCPPAASRVGHQRKLQRYGLSR